MSSLIKSIKIGVIQFWTGSDTFTKCFIIGSILLIVYVFNTPLIKFGKFCVKKIYRFFKYLPHRFRWGKWSFWIKYGYFNGANFIQYLVYKYIFRVPLVLKDAGDSWVDAYRGRYKTELAKEFKVLESNADSIRKELDVENKSLMRLDKKLKAKPILKFKHVKYMFLEQEMELHQRKARLFHREIFKATAHCDYVYITGRDPVYVNGVLDLASRMVVYRSRCFVWETNPNKEFLKNPAYIATKVRWWYYMQQFLRLRGREEEIQMYKEQFQTEIWFYRYKAHEATIKKDIEWENGSSKE
jgi:hypothetical protein